MHSSANVTSIPALNEFRTSLCTFIDQAKDAQVMLDMEIRHLLEWLDEQKILWKAEIRAAEDAVFQAKLELSRKRMLAIGDRPPDTTEEEKVLKRAQMRLEHARDKYAATRRWLTAFPEEVLEYEGPNRLLQGFLEGELPRMVALLEQKVAALEAYSQIQATPPKG